MDKPCRRAVAVLAAAMIWFWTGPTAAVETATVAKTGDVAPGTGGATFTSLGTPVVNGAGEAMFRGFLGACCANQGLWFSDSTGLSLVARATGPAPGTGGATFMSFSTTVLNGASEIAFIGNLTVAGGVTSMNDQGIWMGKPGGLTLLAREGDAATGAGGATFRSFSPIFSPLLNGAGQVAFLAELSDLRSSIWLSGPAGLVPVAITGEPAPGAGGATFSSFGEPALNSAGVLAFTAELDDLRTGIWHGSPSSLTLTALEGQPAPGTIGAAFSSFGRLFLNDAGEVAFGGDLDTGNSLLSGSDGIWVSGSAGLLLVAKASDPAPGAGGAAFRTFFPSGLNGAGELAILGFLTVAGGVTTANDSGYWVGAPGGLTLVAREGNTAPGTGSAIFDSFTFGILLNGAGEVAFRAKLLVAGSVNAGNDRGMWAGPSGGLQLIAREGDDIQIAPGTFKTIGDPGVFSEGGSGNQDGRKSGLGEGGQVGFTVRFTDLSDGVFLAPPEAPQVHLLSHRTVDSGWHTIFPPQHLTKPVVISGPPGSADKAPGVVRLRNVGARSFEARFQEWKYLDGTHPEETLDFMVMEKGRHKMADGSIWEAGILKVGGNGDWKAKSFTKKLPGTPKVFLTVQGAKERTPVAVRARNVTRKGFEAALFEEEKQFGGKHRKEKVGYLAVYSAANGGTITGGVSGTPYALKRPRTNHKFKTVLGQEIKLEEEKSKDKERKHARERVSVMGLGRGFFAQQMTDKETDTTAIRRR